MSLLQIVEEASRNPKQCDTEFPIVIDAAEAFRKLLPERPEDDPSLFPIKKLTGWQIPGSAEKAAQVAEILQMLDKKVKSRPTDRSRKRINEILDGLSRETLESLLPGGEAAHLVAQVCAKHNNWEKLEAFINSGFIGRCDRFDFVGELAKNHRAELLCLCARRVSDLRSSQLLRILKYFLSPSKDSLSGMSLVRNEWKSQGLLAIEKATDKDLSSQLKDMARDCSVLIMMAHDGFTSNELCLHHVFSSQHMEGLVMSTAIAGLNGKELFGIVRYFRKWLEKYDRFPEATPCSDALKWLGLQAPEWVPSLDSVARGFSLVLDQHFSILIRNPQYQQEMLSVMETVSSLTSMAKSCRYLSNLIQKLPSS